VDAILDLPVDAVGWRLRLRLADLRSIIGVEKYPTLRVDPSAQPEPEPMTERVLEIRPEARPAPIVSERAASMALLAGVRNDRMKALGRRAVEEGFVAHRTAAGHIALERNGHRIMISGTSSGLGRAWQNLRAEAKRAGLDTAGL